MMPSGARRCLSESNCEYHPTIRRARRASAFYFRRAPRGAGVSTGASAAKIVAFARALVSYGSCAIQLENLP